MPSFLRAYLAFVRPLNRDGRLLYALFLLLYEHSSAHLRSMQTDNERAATPELF